MSSLEERLAGLPAPGSSEAQERAMIAVGDAADDGRLRRSLSRRARWLGAVGATVLLGLSPPGQAIAERLGELVGIGDEPTEGGIGPSVVIGLGEVNGVPYEVVASSRLGIVTSRDDLGKPCIGLEIPGVPGLTSYNCVTSEFDGELTPVVSGAPRELGEEAELIVQGLAPPSVERVDVAYRPQDGDERMTAAQVSPLTAELAGKIGAEDGTRFFMAFLPRGILLPPDRPEGRLTEANAAQALARIEVTAYDVEGSELERVRLSELDHHELLARVLADMPPDGRFSSDGMRERSTTE